MLISGRDCHEGLPEIVAPARHERGNNQRSGIGGLCGTVISPHFFLGNLCYESGGLGTGVDE